MTTVFKNVVTEIDTTGSAQLIFRCPTGKTALIKTLTIANENGSNSNYFLAFKRVPLENNFQKFMYITNFRKFSYFSCKFMFSYSIRNF